MNVPSPSTVNHRRHAQPNSVPPPAAANVWSRRRLPLALLLGLALWLPCRSASAAADDLNPFEQAAQETFTGLFTGTDVTLFLRPQDGLLTGTLDFKGQSYPARGGVTNARLDGTFTSGTTNFAFSLTSEGPGVKFTARTISTQLQRASLPKFEGTLAGASVSLKIEGQPAARTGSLRFKDRDYTFTAKEENGGLRGNFSNGSKTYPFTVGLEGRTLVFKSGPFSEPLTGGQGGAVENSLGMKFVPVPGTEVQFCIWETRVQDYAAYAKASGVEPEKASFEQGPTHPAVNVSWDDAQAFCKWLTEKEQGAGRITQSQRYRLPTDAEWSKAVGLPEETGATPGDKSMEIKDVWPWGTTWPPPKGAGNYADTAFRKKYTDASTFKIIEGYDDGYAYTAPVGSFTANKLGLYDLGGNVWEWCEDWYDNEKKYRGLRGGSWLNDDPVNLLSSGRDSDTPDGRNRDYGFRCVLVGGLSR